MVEKGKSNWWQVPAVPNREIHEACQLVENSRQELGRRKNCPAHLLCGIHVVKGDDDILPLHHFILIASINRHGGSRPESTLLAPFLHFHRKFV